MNHLAKLRALYVGARALQLASAAGIVKDYQQADAHQAYIDTLASNLEAHLAIDNSLPSEYEIMLGVMKLSTVGG